MGFGIKLAYCGHDSVPFTEDVGSMKKLCSLVALSLALTAPMAAALTADEARECQALAASFGPAKSALETKIAKRDALAAEAEVIGEAWENAENVRTLGAEAAAEADALKITFEDQKTAFNALEAEIFEESRKLNKGFTRFNNLCVTE